MGSNFIVVKFDGKGDFSLWKWKIKAVLMQQKVDLAIGEEADFPTIITEFQRNKMKKTAYSTIFLHFSNSVTRECGDSEDPAVIWKKLDELFLTKTLPNIIYKLFLI